MNELIQKIAVYALPVLFAITVHEASHGYVARMFGDTTAFVAGRVSLNPLKHIDPIGTIVVPAIMLLLSGMMFGWAKPVPVNFGALRHPKRDMIWVAAAGPMSNLVMAIIWTLFLTFQQSIGSDEQFFQAMALAGVQVNLIFMALNLLPIPPLDGGRILVGLLPNRLANGFARLEPFGLFIVIGLMVAGVLGFFLAPFLELGWAIVGLFN